MNTDINIEKEAEKILQRFNSRTDAVVAMIRLCNRVRTAQKERQLQKVKAIPTTRAITDVMRVGGQEPRSIDQYRDDVLAAIRADEGEDLR